MSIKKSMGKATQFFILLTILFEDWPWRMLHIIERTRLSFVNAWLSCCLEWCGQYAGPGRRQEIMRRVTTLSAKSWLQKHPGPRMLTSGRRPSRVHEALPSVWPYCVGRGGGASQVSEEVPEQSPTLEQFKEQARKTFSSQSSFWVLTELLHSDYFFLIIDWHLWGSVCSDEQVWRLQGVW